MAKEKKENIELKEASRRQEAIYKNQIRELSQEKLHLAASAEELR